MKGPTILVVGNEGYGLRTNVRRACTGMVQVDGLGSMMEGEGSPGLGTETTVDSLNVSVAAGILLHSLLSSAGKRAMPQTTPNPAAPST